MTTTDTTQRRPYLGLPADGGGAGWTDPSVDLQPSRLARWLPLVAWLATLTVAISLLLALGGGRLAAPDLTAPGTWAAWATGRDPLEVTMVVVRLLGLGLSWYLVGVTSISVLSRLLRAARLVRVADALSIGPVRTIAQQAVGVGLAAGVLVTAVPPTPWHGTTGVTADAPVAVDGPVATETLAPLTGPVGPLLTAATPTATDAPSMTAPVPVPAPTTPSASSSPTPTREPTTSSPTDPAAPLGPEPAAPTQPAAPEEPSVPADATARTATVGPGDHFWRLAEDDLGVQLGRTPSEDEVAAHWAAVVDANRERLVVPGNPDLLLPGQQVVLPPAAGAAP